MCMSTKGVEGGGMEEKKHANRGGHQPPTDDKFHMSGHFLWAFLPVMGSPQLALCLHLWQSGDGQCADSLPPAPPPVSSPLSHPMPSPNSASGTSAGSKAGPSWARHSHSGPTRLSHHPQHSHVHTHTDCTHTHIITSQVAKSHFASISHHHLTGPVIKEHHMHIRHYITLWPAQSTKSVLLLLILFVNIQQYIFL